MVEPTNVEIVRRLDEVGRSIERLASTLERSYIRMDVYEVRHEALKSSLNARLNDLHDDIVEVKAARVAEQGYRRQILAGIAVLAVGILINLALATSNLIARGALG